MSDLKFNKIFGAVLGAGLGVMAVGILADSLYHVEQPDTPGFMVEIAEDSGSAGAAQDTGPIIPDFGTVIPAADIAAGEKVAKKCVSCHSFEQGGANKTGPNLWGVMGAKPAGRGTGFGYSDALKAYGETHVWDYETMYAFLENPKGEVPGTAMAYAGLRKSDQRVALIAYLRSLDANPIPVPAPKPAEPEPAPEAEGEEAAAETVAE